MSNQNKNINIEALTAAYNAQIEALKSRNESLTRENNTLTEELREKAGTIQQLRDERTDYLDRNDILQNEILDFMGGNNDTPGIIMNICRELEWYNRADSSSKEMMLNELLGSITELVAAYK